MKIKFLAFSAMIILTGCFESKVDSTTAGTNTVSATTDRGVLDPTVTWLGAGYYSAIDLLALPASSVCIGTSIFGSAGTAVCNSLFGDLTASNMYRNINTPQMTLTIEKSNSSYAVGYREIPDASKDDDGAHNAAAGCTGAGGEFNTCSTVIYASRPTTDCGQSGSIVNRIADCLAQNGSLSSWDGRTSGNSGEGKWTLVTRMNSAEVWRDDRTGLLWSDITLMIPGMGGTLTWCQATGNNQSDDPAGICNDFANQDQGMPYSACAEFPGAQPVFGDDYTMGTYSSEKGGMGLLSTDVSVRWRVPTIKDYYQAEINGIRFVLPNFGRDSLFWSSTVASQSRRHAYLFSGRGSARWGQRGDLTIPGFVYILPNAAVRCVGRSIL